MLASLTEADGVTPRLITGLVFDTSESALTAYVSHGQYVDPGDDSDRSADEWTGKITRLSGASLQNELDVVVGLPRSVYDHLNNQPVFGPDGRLYWVQPSNTAMGAPDATWGFRPERLLTAAVLAADVRSLTTTVDVQTEDGKSYDPYAVNAPVTIYATGIRNAYDLVWTPAGHLYAPANGSAAGGNAPAQPGGVSGINGVNQTQNDLLYRVEAGGYYGHPNPVRGEYILAGGNPTAGVDLNEVSQYPVGTQPEANYRGFAHDFGKNVSPNGVVRYDSGGAHFGGALDGKLLVVRYSGGDDVMFLETDEATGNVLRSYAGGAGLGGLSDPLDVAVDPATGFVYVVEAGFRTSGGDLQITLLTPVEAGTLDNDAAVRDFGNGDTLYFGTPTSTADAITFTLTNSDATGTIAFPDDALTITGVDSDSFRITSGDLAGTQLLPGESITVTIAFEPDAVGVFDAELHLRSNDSGSPDSTLRLRGLGTAGEGGNLEPSLQRLLDLYELPIATGDPDPTTTDYPQDSFVSGSDEVLLQLMQKAGDGPVTVEVLGSFGTSNANSFDDTSELSFYLASLDHRMHGELFTIDKAFAQSVRPETDGTLSFEPVGDFGLVGTFFDFGPRDVYSEDQYNGWALDDGEGFTRKLRFFPLKDASGDVVPDAYVFAFEEWDQASDQNDLVGIIRNVRPAESSYDLELENVEHPVFGTHLTFSRIENLDPVVGNKVSDLATLRITNSGQATEILDVSIDSPDFEIVSGGEAGTLAAGATRDIVVRFVYSSNIQSSYGDGDNVIEPGDDIRDIGRLVRTATLTISTNDPDVPTRTATLGGLWQSHSEEGNTGTSQEASLNEIVAAFGWNIDVGPFTGQGNYGTGQNTGGEHVAIGEEILSDYWNKAGSGSVEVIQIAAFHQQRDPQFNGSNTPRYDPATSFYWHFESDARNDLNRVFRHDTDFGQSLLPLVDGESGAAAGTFDPGNSSFAVSVDRSHYSDRTRNDNQSHSFRFFALKDASGTIIPNAYLVAQDNGGTGDGTTLSGSNYDHQDNVYILLNVQPVLGAERLENVVATGTQDGNSVSWDAASEGNVNRYIVRRTGGVVGASTILGTVSSGTSFLDTTAVAGVAYSYEIRAVDYHGTEGAGNTVSATRPAAPSAPATPTSLTATATSPDAVTLAWLDVGQETGYRVLRSVAGGTFTQVASLPANSVSWTDTNVDGQTSYAYQLVAINSVGDSSPASASVTTPIDLSAAVAVTASADGHDSVTVNWSDASDNEAGFRIERATGDGPFAAVGTTAAGAESFVDTTVEAETTYRYRLVTLGSGNAAGETSTIASVTTLADPADVAAPTNLTVSLSWNEVALTWQHDGVRVTNFQIRRDGVLVATVAGAARSWTDNTVSPETSYSYDIVGINVVGAETFAGPAAGPLAVVTPRNPADLSAPGSFAAEAVTRSQVNLSWSPVPSATFYVVERRVSGGSWSVLSNSIPSTQLSFVDNTAAPATTFEYRVRARNAFNPASGPFATATVTTVAADAITGNAIGTATGSLAGDKSAFTLTATGTDDATDLGDDDHVFFAHRLFVGDFDVVITVASFDKADPASAAGIMVRDDLSSTGTNVFLRFSGDVAMSWRNTPGGETRSPTGATAAPDAPYLRLVRTGDTFTGYVSANGMNWTLVATSDPIPMSASVRVGGAVASYSLAQSTAAFTDFGTYQEQPPVAPTGISANVGDAVTVTWADASPNETGYRVERRVDPTLPWQTVSTLDAGSTAYTDTTTAAGTTYFYRVVAFNDAGETASPVVNATRADQRPGVPGDGVTPPATQVELTDVTVTWPTASGDVLGYIVERRSPGGEWRELSRVSTGATGLRDATAGPGSTFEYRVRAFNNDGIGEASAAMTVSTPAAASTTAPELSASRTAAGVLVTWSEAEDVVIERRLEAGDWIRVGTFSGTTMLDEGSSAVDATYRVRLAGAGQEWSEPVTVAAASDVQTATGPVGSVAGSTTVVRDFEHIDLTATGGDAWGFEDAIQFAGFSISGDFDVGVRTIASGTGDWMAGLVVRSSGDAGASNVFLKLRENDVRLTARGSEDGQTVVVADADTTPAWLRLVRRGDDVIGLTSTDGTTWSEVGRTRVSLGDTVNVGVAGAGGEDGSVDARFREFRHFSPDSAPADVAALPAAGRVGVRWQPVTHALVYRVDRRPVGGVWETIATLSDTNFDDATAEAGIRYAYRVSADGSPFSAATPAVAPGV